MQSSRIFIRIYHGGKRNELINDWEILLHIGKNPREWCVDEQVWFVTNTGWLFEGPAQSQENFCNFYSHLSLQAVF